MVTIISTTMTMIIHMTMIMAITTIIMIELLNGIEDGGHGIA